MSTTPTTPTTDPTLANDAMAEAIRRYGPKGDVEGALIFFRCATQPLEKATEADIAWARECIPGAFA